ncbi:MAG: hypothetical protein NTY66_02405 [Candidatus Vogelbacteria bacterium]|nr:hypothetical protein [Candidatus Vogelbacteria bacterium]
MFTREFWFNTSQNFFYIKVAFSDCVIPFEGYNIEFFVFYRPVQAQAFDDLFSSLFVAILERNQGIGGINEGLLG